MIEFLSLGNLEEAIDFAEKFHADAAWRDYPFKREVLRKNVEKMIGNDNYFTCLYRKGGQIVGCWFGSLGSFLFSDVLFGMENGIFIERAHRGGRCAFLMYQAFKKWCEERNVESIFEIQFGSEEDNQGAYSFFSKLGMIECGKIFRSKSYGMSSSSTN